jgi:hypothetical protein
MSCRETVRNWVFSVCLYNSSCTRFLIQVSTSLICPVGLKCRAACAYVCHTRWHCTCMRVAALAPSAPPPSRARTLSLSLPAPQAWRARRAHLSALAGAAGAPQCCREFGCRSVNDHRRHTAAGAPARAHDPAAARRGCADHRVANLPARHVSVQRACDRAHRAPLRVCVQGQEGVRPIRPLAF